MSFELLPTITPWLVGFAVVVVVGVAVAVGILGALAAPVVSRNRRTRLARGENLRSYYAHRFALHH